MTAYSLRARYLSHEDEFSHRDYYGALVEFIGEDALRLILPGPRTPAEWRALVEVDHALNNVPLKQWDALHPLLRRMVNVNDPAFMEITGAPVWSLSDSVCTLKECARRYSETEVST